MRFNGTSFANIFSHFAPLDWHGPNKSPRYDGLLDSKGFLQTHELGAAGAAPGSGPAAPEAGRPEAAARSTKTGQSGGGNRGAGALQVRTLDLLPTDDRAAAALERGFFMEATRWNLPVSKSRHSTLERAPCSPYPPMTNIRPSGSTAVAWL